jgi:hypothetical protein
MLKTHVYIIRTWLRTEPILGTSMVLGEPRGAEAHR